MSSDGTQNKKKIAGLVKFLLVILGGVTFLTIRKEREYLRVNQQFAPFVIISINKTWAYANACENLLY